MTSDTATQTPTPAPATPETATDTADSLPVHTPPTGRDSLESWLIVQILAAPLHVAPLLREANLWPDQLLSDAAGELVSAAQRYQSTIQDSSRAWGQGTQRKIDEADEYRRRTWRQLALDAVTGIVGWDAARVDQGIGSTPSVILRHDPDAVIRALATLKTPIPKRDRAGQDAVGTAAAA